MSHKIPIEQRFWPRVDKTTSCWNWLGFKDKNGYGQVSFNGKGDLAHRVILLMQGIEIPKGYEVDHLCRNKGCVNPAHLEVVTQRENNLRSNSYSGRNARKIFCKYEHQFTEENTTRIGEFGRRCRECSNERVAKWRAGRVWNNEMRKYVALLGKEVRDESYQPTPDNTLL